MKLHILPVGTLATNCYILCSGEKNCIVIDPGMQADKIIAHIREEGLTVRHILLTHGHYDHIGAVKQIAKAFRDSVVSIGEGDLEMLGCTQKSLAVHRSADPSEYIIQNANVLLDGDVIELDELRVSVIQTPGHTKGGVCYAVGNMLFTGDTLFLDDIGRCDLYGGSYPIMKRSLAKLCEIPGDFEVYPGHGESTTLDYERRNNRYILEPMRLDDDS